MINKLLLAVTLVTVLTNCNQKTTSDRQSSEANKIEQEDSDITADQYSTKVTTITKTDKDTPGVSASTANQVNQEAPAYMKLDLKGYKTENINLSKHFGEVVFVNHWGSWCPPCRAEMPSIQKLYEAYGDKVKFVTIATEKRANAYVDYLSKNDFTFPVYEPNGPMATDLKPNGFPTTIIIDKMGKIVVSDVGAADWNSPSVHKQLDKLLAE